MTDRLTILVSGMIAGTAHHGGATWAVLQYVLGFMALGHEVFFIEPLKQAALLPAGASFDESENAAYFSQVVESFGLRSNSALLLDGKRQTVGLTYGQLQQISRRVDVLVNISGLLQDDALIANIAVRIYMDLDPGFTQLWQAAQNIDMRLSGHTHHVTIGMAIGTPACAVPTCDIDWLKTFQPVVLKYWPMTDELAGHGMTTVANWRGYGSIDYQGVFYGQKVHSLRRFMALPRFSCEKFVLALAIHEDESDDLEALAANGWQLVDPQRVASTPAKYQEFVQQSKAEFGIAKSGYVAAHCGWFSDRSICYLASGRPVIAQETGFSRFLPTGEGLFAFESQADVLASIESLSSDYVRHRRAARDIAETCFGSDAVLSRLLRHVGATP